MEHPGNIPAAELVPTGTWLGRSIEKRWAIQHGPLVEDSTGLGLFVATAVMVSISDTEGAETRYSVYAWLADPLNRRTAQFDGTITAGVPAPRRTPLPDWVEELVIQVANELESGSVS